MAKYYYNGVLLPEIPADKFADHPNQMIVKWPNGNIQLIGSKNGLYFNGSTVAYDKSNATLLAYYLSEDIWVEDANQSGKYTGWTIISNGVSVLHWSNHNIPSGSASATDIYFRGSQPTLTRIHLVNQWNAAIGNDVAELTMALSGCTPGNMLICAYAVRGADNVVTLSAGWNFLGGGNNISTPEDSYQYVLFAYKMAESAAETITISQTEGKRIYAVCSEYFGVAGVKLRSDLAAIGTTNYTVTGRKTKAEDVMLYAVTSAYYGSGRNQTVTPTDLDKIEGDSSAERLACWFDGGLGATSHIFQSYNATEARDAVLECVQLVLYDIKYLIRSGSTLYTITDGNLTALTETEVTASLFQTYGVDDVPDGTLLLGLTDPEVLYWHDSTDDPPELTLTVTGSPPVPQIVITSTQDMSDPSILGIESATVDASDDVLFAISFDDGVTWKAYDGAKWVTLSTENSGMTKTTMENISLESWAEVAMSAMYKLRFVLMDTDSYVAAVRMNYIN